MKCDKCNGSGYVYNKRYYAHSTVESYEKGISPEVKCVKCGGSGFIIGNIDEALHDLTVLFNTETNRDRKRILKQVIELIQK